jgi:hypothetical protein
VIRIGTALFAFHVSRADELVLFNSLRDSHVLRPDPVFPPLVLASVLEDLDCRVNAEL